MRNNFEFSMIIYWWPLFNLTSYSIMTIIVSLTKLRRSRSKIMIQWISNNGVGRAAPGDALPSAKRCSLPNIETFINNMYCLICGAIFKYDYFMIALSWVQTFITYFQDIMYYENFFAFIKLTCVKCLVSRKYLKKHHILRRNSYHQFACSHLPPYFKLFYGIFKIMFSMLSNF